MPEHNPGQLGGTMRLGRRKTVFKTKNSTLSNWIKWIKILFLLNFFIFKENFMETSILSMKDTDIDMKLIQNMFLN
jgi:hypothetical protein